MAALKPDLTPFSDRVSEILEAVALDRGYSDPRWLTEKQANSGGGTAWTRKTCFRQQARVGALSGVKSSELSRGVEVKRWIPITDDDGEPRWVPSKRPLIYFNVEQCFGVIRHRLEADTNGQILTLSGTLEPLDELLDQLNSDSDSEFERMLDSLLEEMGASSTFSASSEL